MENELDQNTNSWIIIRKNNLQQKESRGKIGKWSFDKKESNPKKFKSNNEANTYKGNENKDLN